MWFKVLAINHIRLSQFRIPVFSHMTTESSFPQSSFNQGPSYKERFLTNYFPFFRIILCTDDT